MPRYIDADALVEGCVCNDPVVIAVKCAPTADVAEVRRGEWIRNENDCYYTFARAKRTGDGGGKMNIEQAKEQWEQEREKGCAFCDEDHDEHDYMNGIQTFENGKRLVLETSEWDEEDDCFNDIRVAVNYCPMCGRKLEPKEE